MALHIHITAGSQNGQRLRAASALSFGREAGNALVIDLPEVSRRHGELVPQPDGSWMLVNHSPNGTLLDGKPVTTSSRPITGEMSVRVGKTEILRLTADALSAAPADAPEAAAPARSKGGVKLWAGIVIGLSTVFIFATFLFKDPDGKPDGPAVHAAAMEVWDTAQVLASVQAPPSEATPDEAAYETNLKSARAAYTPGKPMRKDAWFEAYRAYRNTMRHHGLTFGEPGDSHDYQVIVDEVARLVAADYQEAALEFNRRSYRTASPLFAKIRDYAGGTDPLFGREFRDHILKLKSLSDTRQKK